MTAWQDRSDDIAAFERLADEADAECEWETARAVTLPPRGQYRWMNAADYAEDAARYRSVARRLAWVPEARA